MYPKGPCGKILIPGAIRGLLNFKSWSLVGALQVIGSVSLSKTVGPEHLLFLFLFSYSGHHDVNGLPLP
jgi:hypothetical protein